MFKNLKIGARLGIAFAVILAMMAVLAYVGITRMAAIKANLDIVVNENNVKTQLANDMRGQINIIARSVRNVALITEDEGMKKESDRIVEARAKYKEMRDKLSALLKTEAAKKIMEDIDADQAKTGPLVDKAVALGLANKNEQATAVILNEVRGPQGKWIDDINAMVTRQMAQTAELVDQAGKDYGVFSEWCG